MDIVPELVQLSRTNIQKQDGDLLVSSPPLRTPLVVADPTNSSSSDSKNSNTKTSSITSTQPIVTLQLGNGYLGLPQYAPFDIIHVGAAALTFPYTLCQQLKVGGLLIVPIQDDYNNDNNDGNGNNNGPTPSQTLYKIERLYNTYPSSNRTVDATTTTTTAFSSQPAESNPSTTMRTADTTITTMLDTKDHPTTSDDSSTFDRNEYRITPLLGVRYVPLVPE
jgi:protein-L-isoaspartate O-methyltransferase